MTLPSSGAISLSQVNTELGYSSTATISLNDSAVRSLAGVSSGTISMSNLYGKSSRVSISYTFTSSTADASLNVTSISGYVAGKSNITITVNGGVYLYATSTSNAGLTLSGGQSGDTITLVNYGYIMGKGGDSPSSAGHCVPNPGYPGGPALKIGYCVTVNNTYSNAYIGGGGGGGASATTTCFKGTQLYFGTGGGGAGGGNAGNCSAGLSGGAGGGPGSSGANGAAPSCRNPAQGGGAGGGGGESSAGGGGGRIFPGSGGYGTHAGCGYGGSGGCANNAGGNGNISGGGGGWGASGGAESNSGFSVAGGAGGKAIQLNGYSVSFVSGCTARVWGSVS